MTDRDRSNWTHGDDVEWRLLTDPAYRAMIIDAHGRAWYHERAWRRGLIHGGTIEAARQELRLSFEGESNHFEQMLDEQRAVAAAWNHEGPLLAGLFEAISSPGEPTQSPDQGH